MSKIIKNTLIGTVLLLTLSILVFAENNKQQDPKGKESQKQSQSELSANPEETKNPEQGEKPSGKPQGMPTSKVVVSEIKAGMIAPEGEFIGTVYYNEVSEVASEISGKVEKVYFDTGDKIKKNATLVKIDTDLLDKDLKSKEALYEQVLTQIEKAKIDSKRMEKLYKENTVSEQEYDNARYQVKVFEKQAKSVKADVGRIKEELQRKSVKSPFDGVIIEKKTEVGQWLNSGETVATIAKADIINIIVDVPETILPFAKPEMKIRASVNNQSVTGKILTIIPLGNTETRTFPVKIRVEEPVGLIEGMEARVFLPTSEKQNCLTVPRDAIVTKFGLMVVFTVDNSTAIMHPVKILGYEGMTAGIAGMGLNEGMKVVIKGNERIQDKQPVEVIEANQ